MTQGNKHARAASDLLWTHWQSGTRLAALPADIRPPDRTAGYAIQACLESRSAAPLFGWKIAATSVAGQRHIGVDGPIAGRLLTERVYGDGDILPFGGNAMRVIEAEFAFRMADDLPPATNPIPPMRCWMPPRPCTSPLRCRTPATRIS